MWETQVWSLGWEGPLEKGMSTHSSILAWNFMNRGAWWATVHGVARSQTWLSDLACTHIYMKCRYSYILKPQGGPRTRPRIPAEHPKAMVFWGNEHSNSWTFCMLWKLKEEIHMARRDNQTFSSEKSLQQKLSVPWNHLILFATLKKKNLDPTPCLIYRDGS